MYQHVDSARWGREAEEMSKAGTAGVAVGCVTAGIMLLMMW